ncbi:type IV secretory system conjugative DNA transfer family protein, partial [Dubosiella newyorkensis]|uniref:type IV secretory system conjugative DNA transfer family protein n=1 Tax=Dubosiella newyorkensis TaxID=1862672 RepID=UPI00259CDF1B
WQNIYSLNGIKNKKVGHGQHGNARFATEKEIKKIYRLVLYEPKKWRRSKGDTSLPQGTVVGTRRYGRKLYAVVDPGDVHTLMIGAAGVGKTACFLYPNLEYACASGMSFLSTDTKGDLARSYGNICRQYGYNVAVIDLRNPIQSDSFNMLSMVNKYMDLYKSTRELSDKAKAEKYAKITAKTIIYSGEGDASSYGQNAFFYDAAEGLLTSVILLVAEYCKPEERHIISVFKLIQDLLAPSQSSAAGNKKMTQFQLLMQKLPDTHKAKWFAGAALNTSEQASNELYCKLNDEDVDRGELLKQIFGLAKYKFDRCTETDTSAITEEIQKVLCGYSKIDKLTAELLNKIISKIHIYDGGRVQIELCGECGSKPKIYKDFNEHMHRVIVLEFFKRIIVRYLRE